jgi:uncharacterized PurR-regulated membrane protein YhhQ (DUF165 family)
MENLPEIGLLATLILGGTQLVLFLTPTLSPRIATIIITVIFGAVAFLIPNGMSVLEIIIALTSQVFVYDFVVKPLQNASKS